MPRDHPLEKGLSTMVPKRPLDEKLETVMLSRTWRDRLLGAGAEAAFTLVILWLVLVSTAAAAVILRA